MVIGRVNLYKIRYIIVLGILLQQQLFSFYLF
jgi:hypothetical protein